MWFDKWLEERVIPEPNSGCWIWLKATDTAGYGMAKDYRTSRNDKAHRLVYRHLIGEIPHGICVCHHCDNRLCCNPDHLFLGTKRDNANDRDRKGRCKRNDGLFNGRHKLTPEEVLEIRLMPGSQQSIADRYGVSQVAISKIKLGKHWRNI